MPMPASTELQFRAARPDDAHAIAGLHADGWQRHYRGAYPNAFLDNDAAGESHPDGTRRSIVDAACRSMPVCGVSLGIGGGPRAA
jgi:hypothetical protein